VCRVPHHLHRHWEYVELKTMPVSCLPSPSPLLWLRVEGGMVLAAATVAAAEYHLRHRFMGLGVALVEHLCNHCCCCHRMHAARGGGGMPLIAITIIIVDATCRRLRLYLALELGNRSADVMQRHSCLCTVSPLAHVWLPQGGACVPCHTEAAHALPVHQVNTLGEEEDVTYWLATAP